jgi:hypothetical protein
MAKKARLGIYLEDEEMKKQIKIAAAKKGISATDYCEEAIKEKLQREDKLSNEEITRRKAILARIEELREKIGPIGLPVSELIEEGRRR